MNIKKIYISIIIFLISGCGYSVVEQNRNFNVKEIVSEGEKRINYKIKTKLLVDNNNRNKNFIKINLKTKKNKNVKEKNIKNEITKYEIIIVANVNYKTSANTTEKNFKLTQIGEYKVEERYSQTLSNEKKLIDLLSQKLADEILDEIVKRQSDS